MARRPSSSPTTQPEELDAQQAAKAAEELFIKALATISELTSSSRTATGDQRLFFPNGIELIHLSFKITTQVDISLTVAGEKAPKQPALPATALVAA
jgi:hypothetical protein